MPCDRRHSPTVRSCQEPARIGRKHNHSCQCLSSARYVDGIKVLAEQFNQSVLAMVRKAAERVSPADTLGNRRRRRRGDRPLGRRSVRVMRLPAAERELSHSPRIFHGGCTVCLNIGSELLKLWCAILGLNQSLTGSLTRRREGILMTSEQREMSLPPWPRTSTRSEYGGRQSTHLGNLLRTAHRSP